MDTLYLNKAMNNFEIHSIQRNNENFNVTFEENEFLSE